MKYHKKYKPYIRRANGNEHCKRVDLLIPFLSYKKQGVKFYVMSIRGFPRSVIFVGSSKRDILKQVTAVRWGLQTFRQWALIRKHYLRYISTGPNFG